MSAPARIEVILTRSAGAVDANAMADVIASEQGEKAAKMCVAVRNKIG